MKYLLVGVANTFIGLSSIYVAMYFFRFDIVAANALGYSIGISFGFILNKTLTFNNSDSLVKTLPRYMIVLVIAYSANLATVLYIDSLFDINHYLIQALGIIPYITIGYLGSRHFAFSKKRTISDIPRQSSNKMKFLEKPSILKPIDLSIVVPCYNEESVISETTQRLTELMRELITDNKILKDSQICFVDDGSTDNTWSLIESLFTSNNFVKGIKLSRNRGHQNALLAGLLNAKGEVIISVDADLQDDLRAIEEMISSYANGHDIVYGVRNSRKTDSFFKRFSAIAFYRLLETMGAEIIYNHADYRLMSRRAIEALREFSEANLFLRGIIPQLGFSHALVYYDRAERYAGESKYPLRKMVSLAWQGITSFSSMPLHFITILGLLVSSASLCLTGWVLWIRLFTQQALPGWASTVIPIYFIGGIQLLCIGIMGEYLAKVYIETKQRPRYIIEKRLL